MQTVCQACPNPGIGGLGKRTGLRTMEEWGDISKEGDTGLGAVEGDKGLGKGTLRSGEGDGIEVGRGQG